MGAGRRRKRREQRLSFRKPSNKKKYGYGSGHESVGSEKDIATPAISKLKPNNVSD